MAKCPYCSKEIIDELNFCIECEQQVKCLACKGLLHKGKSRCLRCGEHLNMGNSSSGTTNSYTLEEETTESSTYRRIELMASDNAIDAFAARLPVGNIPPLRTVEGKYEAASSNKLLAPSEQVDSNITGSQEVARTDSDVPESEISIDTLDPPVEIEVLFSSHSQFELIPSKSLRDYIQSQSTIKDRQQTFIMLYVWAFNKRVERNITKSELLAVLRHENLYDSNTGNYLGKLIKNYFVVDGDTYRINDYDGRQRVEQILSEVKNPKPKTKTTGEKRSKKTGRPSGSLNKKELEKISPWMEKEIGLPANFDIRRLSGATDWALFTIYILTKLLSVESAVEPGVAYTFISKKYPTLPITRKNFRDTLSRDKNNVQKSVKGSYSLTERGETKIKQTIESN